MRVFSINQTYIVTVATEQAAGAGGQVRALVTVPLIVVVELTFPDF